MPPVRLVVFTGKGGVGTTTTAAATAARAAGQGLKTLLLSVGSSLADVLATSVGAEPAEVAAGLFAQRIDPRQVAARVWDPVRTMLPAALDDLGLDPVGAEDLADLPGLDALLTLVAVREQVHDGPWDLVVLDCPAAFEVFAVPAQLERLLLRLLPMERRIDRLTARGMTGDPLVTAVDGLARELASVRSMLSGARVRLVLTPEATVLAHSRRLFTALVLSGLTVDAVVANKVFPPGVPGDRGGWPESRRDRQQELLEETSAFGVPVQRVEYAPGEPAGVRALAALEVPDGLSAPEGLPAPEGQVDPDGRIERTGTGFTLHLALPLARRDDLDLGRRGDDLVITAAGYRRVLHLPAALRRCEVTGASLRDGTLAVRFVPDPAQFPARWV